MEKKTTAAGQIEWTFEKGPVQAAKLFLPEGDGIRPLVAVMGSDEGEEWFRGADAALLLVSVRDWNRDLSPWPAKAVFRDGDFSGGGEETLRVLEKTLLPLVLAEYPAEECWCMGYSLGGLFALWASLKSSLFSRCAAVSGSYWFDGLAAYAQESPFVPSFAYLSLGDKEKKTRNERMASVETRMGEIAETLKKRGAEIQTHLNPGNHFQNPEGRMQLGLQALLERGQA